MNLCGKIHEEIVFDGKTCPLCEALTEIDILIKKVESLEP